MGLERRAVQRRRLERAVLEAEQEVVSDGAGENVGRIADIGDPPPGHRLGQPLHLDLVDQYPAAIDVEQVGEDHGQLLLAAAGRADDGDAARQRRGETGAIQNRGIVLGDQGEVGGAQLAAQVHGLRVDGLQVLVAHAIRVELGDHLVVLDMHVHHHLIIAEQLLPRGIQLLVGTDHRDQRAEREITGDHQIAADRVEEERPKLGEEVIQEFDEELLL